MIKKLATLASNKSLLIVDDERDLVEELEELFSVFFENVDIACDGIEAIKLIENNNYDILATDIYMPRKNGIELIKELKEKNLIYPNIIVFSAEKEGEFIEKLRKDGIIIIEKPAEEVQLFEALINLLDK